MDNLVLLQLLSRSLWRKKKGSSILPRCSWSRVKLAHVHSFFQKFDSLLGASWTLLVRLGRFFFHIDFFHAGVDFDGHGVGLGEVSEGFFESFCLRRRDVERRRQPLKNF